LTDWRFELSKATIHEIARHVFHLAHLDRLLLRRRIGQGLDVKYLSLQDRRDVFDYVYENGVWLGGREEGALSGPGSEFSTTKRVRDGLPKLLSNIDGRSLLDVGCGDFNWMQHVDLVGVDYLGVDIVQAVIADNNKRFGSENRRFRHLDAISEDLPIADAVLCREILFHLSFADGRQLLRNVKRSGASHLIATSDTANRFNSNIKTGDFRALNLQRGPYRFPAPLTWIADDDVMPGRILGVWDVTNI
jgi:SAM-dependent methyltransferase